MTKREIAALACRILALLGFINSFHLAGRALVLLASYVQSLNVIGFPESPWVPIAGASPWATLLIFSAFLWTRADFIATQMAPHDEAKTVLELNVSAQQFAVWILGIYALLDGLPRAMQVAFRFLGYSWRQSIDQRDWSVSGPDLLAVSVEVGLGLWLVFGSASFVKLFGYLQRAGRDLEPSRQETEDDSVSLRPEN